MGGGSHYELLEFDLDIYGREPLSVRDGKETHKGEQNKDVGIHRDKHKL